MFKTSKLALLQYIKDQLLFKDSVTLPGLGSFEINRVPSKIVGKKITPPSVQVVFNTERSLDDGNLASSIASAEDINQEEAGQKILEYIDEILFALNKGEKYVFEGFGTLSRDSENIFHFERDADYQIEFESYGLESFELDPIEEIILEENKTTEKERVEASNKQIESKAVETVKQTVTSHIKDKEPEKGLIHHVEAGKPPNLGQELNPPKTSKNNRNIFWILTGAVFVILVSFIIIKLSTNLLDGGNISFFNSVRPGKTEIFPEDEKWDEGTSLNDELGEALDSLARAENALTIKEASEPQEKVVVAEEQYNEFHIIAGSFKDKVNAGILQQELTLKGYPALVVKQGEQLYRVSAISFKNKEQGLQELSSFKQKTKNNAAWLLKL